MATLLIFILSVGLISFLLVLTPFSTMLMGWSGSTTNSALVMVGAIYWLGTGGMALAGILEWIIG